MMGVVSITDCDHYCARCGEHMARCELCYDLEPVVVYRREPTNSDRELIMQERSIRRSADIRARGF